MNFAVLQVFYAVFSGVIEGFAIANEFIPYGSPFLALFCLSPLYIALYNAKSYKESFVLFFIQILTVHLISSYWLANFHGFAAFTLGASAAGTAFEGGMMGIIAFAYPSAFKKDKALKEKSGADSYSIFKRILWFASVWVLYEYEKSVGAMGYPWGTVSMAAYRWNIFTQIADIAGTYGITFIYAVFSALIAEGILLINSNASKKTVSNYAQALYFTVALFALTGTYGIFQYLIPRIPEKFFNAVLVQQNVDPWEGGDRQSIEVSKRLTQKGIETLAEEDKETDLVVWSEGVLGKSFPAARYYYSRFPEEESLHDFIENTHVPFLIGGMARINYKKRQVVNTAILFDKEGTYSGFYGKIQLVPFAEKIPFYDNVLMNHFAKNIIGLDSTLTSGFQYVLFKIPLKTHLQEVPPVSTGHRLFETIELDEEGFADERKAETYINGAAPNPNTKLSFTTPICFEDAFPSVCRNLYGMGSEIFLNITNDSWSKTRSSEIQHFIVASYRAIEFRTTLVRCANSGYTAVVNPAGKILADLPLFTEDTLACSIPIYKRQMTVYAQYGDWFVTVLALAVLAFMVYSLYKIWQPYFMFKIKQNKRVINIEPEEELPLVKAEEPAAEKLSVFKAEQPAAEKKPKTRKRSAVEKKPAAKKETTKTKKKTSSK